MNRSEVAFPNVVVLVWALSEVFQALALQNLGEPRIVAPVHLNDAPSRIGWNIAEAPVGGAALAFRVPCHPKFAVVFAKGRV